MSSIKVRTLADVSRADSDGSPPVTPPVTLAPGEIQFFDHWMPPLEDGLYKITVSQQIGENVGAGGNQSVNWLADPFVQEQKFLISGPRFTLDASEVYSIYPPANGHGDFTDTLPHIILARRTLPWERTLDGNPPNETKTNVPWLALLLFDEDEIIAYDSPLAPGSTNTTLARSYPINEIINPGAGILGPQITQQSINNEHQQDTSCLAIDVPCDVFLAVVPALDELKYLSHCREVNTGNKEILGMKADGWFSVVIGNRMPNCPVESPPTGGAKNIVHLVSLEGFMSYLPGGGTPIPTGTTRVRLVSLASWSFNCAAVGGNFAYLAENLNLESDAALKLPVAWAESPPVLTSPASPVEMGLAEDVACEALDLGYVPLAYTMRHGEQTVAWYRGPLTPVSIEAADLPPFTVEEEAMIYDPATGLFDLSYSVAWQIGRLLALSDRTFSLELLNWLRAGHRLVDILQARIHLFQNLGETLDFPHNTGEMLDPKLMQHLVGSFVANDLARLVVPSDAQVTPLLGTGCDPSGLSKHLEQMPGLLSRDELEALLSSGSDPVHELRRRLFGE